MNTTKINSTCLATAVLDISNSSTDVTSLYDNLSNFATKAWFKAYSWTKDDTYITKHISVDVNDAKYYHTVYNDEGVAIGSDYDSKQAQKDYDAAYEQAEKYIKSQKEAFIAYRNQIYNPTNANTKIRDNVTKMESCIRALYDGLTAFENYELNIEDARASFYSMQLDAAFACGMDNETIQEIIDGQDVESFRENRDGSITTMVERQGTSTYQTTSLTAGLGSARTTMSSMSKGIVAAAAYLSATGGTMDDFEQFAKNIINSEINFDNYAMDNGLYDGKDEEGNDISVMDEARNMFIEVYGVEPTEDNLKAIYQDILAGMDLTDEEMKALAQISGAGTGCAVIDGISPSLIIAGANGNAIEYTPSASYGNVPGTVSYTPGASTSIGTTAVVTPSAIIQESVVNIGESTIRPFTPQISLPATEDVPTAIKTSIDVSTIDSQAEEIFYSRTPDQIAADRANALAAVDQAFSGENVAEFKEVLKQGGFEDVDIDAIMENKEVAVTAYILASESKNLTDIANKIAIANGIDNFDTSFDNGLNRMSLENGLSQSKLMAEVDDDVVEARNNVKSARSKYNDSAKKANEDIEDADEKRKEMEDIKKKIVAKSGEDTSKWDDDDVDAYNKAVDAYNKANKQANDSYTEAMNDKNSLTEAEKALTDTQEKTTQEYLDNYNEYNSQQANNGTTETTQTTNTDEGIFEIDGNPDSTLSVDDIKIDDSGNATISENAGTVEINGNPDSTLSVDDIKIDANGNVSISENAGTIENVENVETNVIAKQVENVDSGTLTDSMINLDGTNDTLSSVVNDTTSFAAANSDGRSLTTDDLMSLFGDSDDLSNIANAERSLDSVDLSSIVSDDRVLPDLVANDETLGNSNFTELASVKNINTGNGLVNFANNNSQNVSDKINEFQNQGISGLGNLDMSSGLSSIQGDAAYSMENNISGNDASIVNDDVAGASVQAKEVEKHTDGVLVEKEDSTISEISDDGRRLESVEID